MSCPVQAAGVIVEVENLRDDLRRRNGADDETTGRDLESDGEEDHLDGGGGDRRHLGSDDAPDQRPI